MSSDYSVRLSKLIVKFGQKGLLLHPETVENLQLLEQSIDHTGISYDAQGRNKQKGTRATGYIVMQSPRGKVRLDAIPDSRQNGNDIYSLRITEFPSGVDWIDESDKDIRTPNGLGLLYFILLDSYQNGGISNGLRTR